MSDLRAYLTPSQDADRRAGRDVFIEAPTEECPAIRGSRGLHHDDDDYDEMLCKTCFGSCRVPISDTVPCPECDGRGWWSRWTDSVGYRSTTCKPCKGTGRVPLPDLPPGIHGGEQ